MSKKTIIVILILLIILILVSLSTVAHNTVALILDSFKLSTPTPEITYGEFPFELKYSIDGKIYVIKDTIICEYDGLEWNESSGTHRVWKKKIKGSGEENVLIIEDGEQKIYCNVGDADYYMNDQKHYLTEIKSITPNLYPIKGGEFHSQQEIMDKYKIELIDWKFSEPIKK